MSTAVSVTAGVSDAPRERPLTPARARELRGGRPFDVVSFVNFGKSLVAVASLMAREKSLLRITRIYPRKNGRPETGRASSESLGGKISFVRTVRPLIARLMSTSTIYFAATFPRRLIHTIYVLDIHKNRA